MKNISISLEKLEKNIYGRTEYTDEALAICWSLSGFEFSFKAERAELHFVPDYDNDNNQPVYLKLVLDNKDERKYGLSTGKEVIFIDDLDDTVHTLRVYRLSEGNCPIKISSVSLYGSEPEVLAPPEMPKLRFEFFGDSITCGYGNLDLADVHEFFTCHEDSTKTYAYLTAKAFSADIRVEAISGQGIVKACNGEAGYRIPDFFEHEMRIGRKPHDFTSWVPQVVVVNAGTNDGGGRVPDDEFKVGADKFIDRIREVYPDAHIFWVYGMMGNRYDAVLSSLIREKGNNDQKLHYVPVQMIYDFKDECGANGHPNLKGQARAAGVLIDAIRAVL